MKLADLQARFQEAIIGDDRTILGVINPSRRLDSAARFAVYSDAYRLRLARFLSEDFSVLRNALGDDVFGALVMAYIEATPSRHPNARWYARQLPDFMQATDPWRSKTEWIDLALFERALGDAFDAADAKPCEISALAALSVEGWPHLRFDFQPSLALLAVSTGTVATYEAAVEQNPLPQRTDEGEEAVLVWRDPGQQVVYRLLDEAETLALAEARARKSFGEICSLLAFRDENDAVAERAAGFLARWFSEGLVTKIDCG